MNTGDDLMAAEDSTAEALNPTLCLAMTANELETEQKPSPRQFPKTVCNPTMALAIYASLYNEADASGERAGR